MADKNYYELLGVSPAATADEIKDAFRDMMYRYHPDHNPGKEEWAVEMTMELVRGFHTLSDPTKKTAYDIEVQQPIKRDVKLERGGLARLLKKDDSEKAREAQEALRRGCGLYDQADKRAQAAAEFMRAAKLAPDRWEPLYNLAVTLAVLGRFSEALDIAARAARLSDAPEARRLQTRLNAAVVGSLTR